MDKSASLPYVECDILYAIPISSAYVGIIGNGPDTKFLIQGQCNWRQRDLNDRAVVAADDVARALFCPHAIVQR